MRNQQPIQAPQSQQKPAPVQSPPVKFSDWAAI